MAISISIDAESIKGVAGHVSGNRLYVDRCGQISLETGDNLEEIGKKLSLFQGSFPISGKDVTLILCNHGVRTKLEEVPILPEKQMGHVIREEMQEFITPEEEFLFDYYVVREKTAQNTGLVLCATIEKRVIDDLTNIFRKSGITLKAIDIYQTAQFHIVRGLGGLQGKTFVLGNLCGNSFEATLYHRGIYIQSVRSQLESRGSIGLISELAKPLSTMGSFLRSKRLEGEIEAIYLTGLSQDEKGYCTNLHNAVGITTEVLESGEADIKSSDKEYSLGEYLFASGGLYRK